MLVVVASVGVAWFYSNEIRSGLVEVKNEPTRFETDVLAVSRSTVTLEATEEATEEGVFGLEWPGGYAQVGRIVSTSPSGITREVQLLRGSPAETQKVHVDPDAFPSNPRQAHGIGFRDVHLASGVGSLPAWYVAGSSDTWAIFVHGRGAPRDETLRMLPVMFEAGLPSLVITYRNDPEAPASPDGLYHLGETEWGDVEAAVRFATNRGARDVVLVGYSTGGSIIFHFLHRSALAPRVRALILDAPALDWGAVVDQGGRNRGLPSFITWLGKVAFAARFDVDLMEFEELVRPEELDVPVLLFHGTEDDTVPIEVSRRLAQARPDLVEFHAVQGAGHVRSWNADPQAYETSVRRFLTEAVGA